MGTGWTEPHPREPHPGNPRLAVLGSGRARHPEDPALAAGALASMPAALCCLDRGERLFYVNPAAESLLARPAAQLLGRPVAELFPAEAGRAAARACREAVTTGGPVAVELPAPGTGGGWLELWAWPGPGGSVFSVVDVTGRRQAQEAARRAQEAAERAQLAAERASARMALLAAVTADLSGALDGESALSRLARLVVPALADACIVTVTDRDGRARDVGSWHADPRRRDLLERYAALRLHTLPPSSPVARALRSGTAAAESVTAVLAQMDPGPARDLLRALGPESAVALPLTAEDRAVGALTLYQDPGRTGGDDDLATAREVAAQAGRTVGLVHRRSQQAQLAEGLQRSLLTDPPEMGRTRVVARYVPAAEAARVGGDWYDAFRHRDGDPIMVIGDVVGHDTAAAAEMGQLRGLLRGIAHYSGAGPAEILRGLDAAIAHMHTGTLATAVVARLESHGTVLRWSNAGHPAPLVAGADGTVTVLGRGTGDLMLGVDPGVARREFRVPLRRGSTVLLHTDGLIERRDAPLDDGVERLRHHLAELAGRPLDRLCDELLARMLPGTPDDDVALVAIAVQPRQRHGRKIRPKSEDPAGTAR